MNIGERIERARKMSNMTQTKLAEESCVAAISIHQNEFPNRLTKLMKAHNKKQQDLASALGVKRQTISLYMNGKSKPDAEQLKIIAQFFNVSADWILGLPDGLKSGPSITELTGLTEEAIKALRKMDAHTLSSLNSFLSSLDL